MPPIFDKVKKWSGIGLGLYLLQAAVGLGYGVYLGLNQTPLF